VLDSVDVLTVYTLYAQREKIVGAPNSLRVMTMKLAIDNTKKTYPLNTYSLNVKLENTVRAFLSGFTSKIKEPSKEYHLLHMQGIEATTPVRIGAYNCLTEEFHIDSDIKSAVILAGGIKAKDILDALLKMRVIDELDGMEYPAVTVDLDPPTYPHSQGVASLESVYMACRYVLKVKCLHDYVVNHNPVNKKVRP